MSDPEVFGSGRVPHPGEPRDLQFRGTFLEMFPQDHSESRTQD